MSNIIRLDFAAETKANEIIDIKSVKDSSRRLKAGLIAPASEKIEQQNLLRI